MEMLAERIYPGELYCLCCGKAIDWSRPYGLCDSCMTNMKWATGRLCKKCGKLLSDNNPEDICYNCRAIAHSFNRGYTCTEYGEVGRAMVYALKYDEKPAIARSIGEIMADRMLSEFTKEELASRYDLLVPVPVASQRLATRGYNQAALIAEFFADNTGLPFRGEVMRRCKETTAMKGLTPAERRRNLSGSFALISGANGSALSHALAEGFALSPALAGGSALDSTPVTGASCLIVDDIMTTGATADEIATVLYSGGAANVDFLSFASGADVIKS